MLPPDESAAVARAAELECLVGNPTDLWSELVDKIQSLRVQEFERIADDFLALMWCLDSYRKAEAPPMGMGKPGQSWKRRLAGAYRAKGNWFATTCALLLENRTGEEIRSRREVVGFSQKHQIDLAWPDREVEPYVCVEGKITGAPGFSDTPARGAIDDWSNRRKELKFAAVDLKLARREQKQSIGHWDVWRQAASPKCYMLWGARVEDPRDMDKMLSEATAMVGSYLDGAGIVAWQEVGGDRYQLVSHPGVTGSSTVTRVDDVLWRIQSEISAHIRTIGD